MSAQTIEGWEYCPECKTWAFELVDDSYNLEAEANEGHPVRQEYWHCHQCGYEERRTREEE